MMGVAGWIHISMWFLAAMGILWVLAIVTFYWPVTMDPDYERGDRLVTEHITDRLELKSYRRNVTVEQVLMWHEEAGDDGNGYLAEAPGVTLEDAAAVYLESAGPVYKNYMHGWYQLGVLTYVVPVFVFGLFGIISSFLASSAKTAPAAHRMLGKFRKVMLYPLPPAQFWQWAVNGVTVAEAFLYLWIVLVEFISFGYAIKAANREYNESENGEGLHAHEIENPSKFQFLLDYIGVWWGVLFFLIGPYLFLPVCRGSLVNTFLGVRYGVAIKWHRWIGVQTVVFILLHGIFYHILWATGGAEKYREEAFRFAYHHWFSNGGGLVAWFGALIIGITAIPWFRRHMYWLFYRAHIVGSVLFVAFGIFHWAGNLFVMLSGLIVYGIDVAYRWFQTTTKVQLHLSTSSDHKMISMAVPLQPNVEYGDGCHVWVCVPALGWTEYHPFSVASSSADPRWRHQLLIHSKIYNRWTEDLVALKAASEESGEGSKLLVKVQGPFDHHTMDEAQEAFYQHLLFVSGGIGATAVLPAVTRAFIRRSEKPSADLPPVTLLFTCRHQCELSILCNVLPHAGSHNCNVIVHYTGKDKLQPGTLNCILPDAASTFSDEHDMEEGNAQIAPKSTKKTPMHLRLPRMIDDRWLELTVWVTSTVAAWTMFVIAEQWISRDPRMALYLMSKYKQMRELEKHAVVSMVIALVVVPLFPLCVIVLWNMLKPRRVSKGDLNETFSHSSSGGLHSDSDKKGGVNNKGEHAAAAVYQALHIQESATGGYTIEPMSPSGLTIKIVKGRPDWSKVFKDLTVDAADPREVGVWTAGPKTFNVIVGQAARASSHNVRVQNLAFEL